ncbi:MAG TPA: polymer-forming cytoskeletal protein [Gemmatimonadaceae bacterium]|nr:polymer-forming cytoskeletal protein [Gemmatimonadaceae bacterium]
MRPLSLLLALAALSAAAPLGAQSPAASTQPAQQKPTLDDKLRHDIARIGTSVDLPGVPPADSFAIGGRTVPAGTTVNGTVAAANGPLEISGHVTGNAIALRGDVVVHKGGIVDGDAVSIGGHVTLDGGSVNGEMRSLSDLTSGPATPAAAPPLTTWGAMKLVLAWFLILAVIAVGVLMFAEHNLNGVVTVLERHLARAFWVGVLTELGLVPLLVVAVAALCITIIGILLVPFAIVAYIIAVAGLLALGFLAVARFTGRGFIRPAPGDAPRAVTLRALFLGIVVYLGVWFVVAALTWMPAAQPVLRAVALAVTWVALTAGLGAAVLSRAGTQHERPRESVGGTGGSEALAWQTPTPVTGVTAARRPLSAPASREGQ